MLFLILVLPAVLSKAPNYSGSKNVPSSGYQVASEHLKASMNLSVDPCADFYEFSCGKWVATNPIPADLTSYSNFEKLDEKVEKEMRELYESKETSSSNAITKVRNIYSACINEKAINRVGTSQVLKEITSMGYWPIVHGSKWKAQKFNLTTLLTKISILRGIDLFFVSSTDPDAKNVTRRLLQFDQGSLGLGAGTRDFYLDKKQFATQMAAYTNLLIDRATQITKDASLKVNTKKIASDVKEVIDFETKFAEITVAEDERRNYTEMYNKRTFKDLISLMPTFDWKRYFLSVTPPGIHAYLKANPEIIIAEPDFLKRMNALLKSTDPEVITNYVIFRYLDTFPLQLGTVYDDIDQDFAREMYGKKEKSPRWKDCLSQANDHMQYASGSMYVRKYFDKNSKATTLAMIADLQEAFRGMLKVNDWMDAQTKKIAEEKVDKMQKLIGYPDFIIVDKDLDKWYKKLGIKSTDPFYKMISKIIGFYSDQFFNRLLEPVDRTEFELNAATVNAFYSDLQNAILFPAAILQVPFFDQSYPKALNYGGIGAVIGHEITHGFDDQGRQFDAMGNLNEWWDAQTSAKFTVRTQCIIDQYGNVTVPPTGMKINGRLTQGENIADNGGVKEAFKAYKQFLSKNGPEKRIPGFEKYDNDQMFFIGYSQNWCGHQTTESQTDQLLTDPHSPGKYRVNVVLQNQPEFAAAFKCPAGSPMNPKKRCTVW